MKVAVIVVYDASKNRVMEVAKGLSEGLSANGHTVEVIDAVLESDKKISFYDYIIVGTEAINTFGGKIPEKVKTYLAQCGTVSGKRSFAFVIKKGLRTGKTLSALMKAMEHEGMYLKFSEVLRRREDGKEIGKRLHISKT